MISYGDLIISIGEILHNPRLIKLSKEFEILRHILWHFIIIKIKSMLTIVLIVAGLLCFVLFFKSIDFFDKI